MKTYLAMIVPVALLIVVLVAGYVSGPVLESPKDTLYAQIDAKVELAQRMLHGYNPVNPRVHALLNPNPTSTQPFEVDAERWREALQPPAEASESDPVAMLWKEIEAGSGDLNAVRARHGELAGDRPQPMALPSGANEAIEEIRKKLVGDQETLDTALATVREAFSLPSEGEASPTDHPAAKRVEAAILYYKAELLRTHAALARQAADGHRATLAKLVHAWQAVDLESRSLTRELTGEAVPVTQEPATAQQAAPAPAAPAAPDNSGGGNLLMGLFKKFKEAAEGLSPAGCRGAGPRARVREACHQTSARRTGPRRTGPAQGLPIGPDPAHRPPNHRVDRAPTEGRRPAPGD